jgi:hypothetical protein
MLAEDWWFWIGAAAAAAGALAAAPAYRRATARLRCAALARGLLDPGPGRRLRTEPGGFWSDPSWTLVLLGAWVAISPWVWGYADSANAVTTDLATGAAVAGIALAGIVFPGLVALDLLLGTWLMIAPWLVGYGGEGGPVGLSDALAGALIAVFAAATLAAAARRTGPAQAVARVRRARDDRSEL